jgi:hypothetical protein
MQHAEHARLSAEIARLPGDIGKGSGAFGKDLFLKHDIVRGMRQDRGGGGE